MADKIDDFEDYTPDFLQDIEEDDDFEEYQPEFVESQVDELDTSEELPTEPELPEEVVDELYASGLSGRDVYGEESVRELAGIEPIDPKATQAALTGLSNIALVPDIIGSAGGAVASELMEDPDEQEYLLQEIAKLKEQGVDPAEFGIESPDESILDKYYGIKDIASEERQKAYEEYPVAAYGGDIASAIAGAGLASKAATKLPAAARALMPSTKGFEKGAPFISKALSAGREGLKGGAIRGFGEGESRLLEGDLEGTAGETLESGMYGGLAGAGLQGAGSMALGGVKGIGKAVRGTQTVDDLLTAFKYGSTTGKTVSQENIRQLSGEVASEVLGDLESILRSRNVTKQQAIDLADEMNKYVNAGDTIEEAYQRLIDKKVRLSGSSEAIESFMEVMQEIMTGKSIAQQRAEQSLVESQIKRSLPDTDEVASLKMEKKVAQDAMKRGETPIALDEGTASADDLIIGGRDEVNVRGRVDVEHRQIINEAGDIELIPVEKITTTDATKFQPTGVTSTPTKHGVVSQYKDVGTGKVTSKITGTQLDRIDLHNASIRELQDLKNELNKYTGVGRTVPEINDSFVIQEAKRLTSDIDKLLKEGLEDVLPGSSKAYQEQSDIFSSLKLAGVDKKGVGARPGDAANAASLSMQKFVRGVSNDLLDRKEMFINHIRKVDPNLASDMQAKFSNLEKLSRITKLETPTKSVNPIIAMFGGLVGAGSKATGAAGALKYKAGKAIRENVDVFAKSNNETIRSMVEALQGSGERVGGFVESLQKAYSQKPDGLLRASILRGLYDQPAFRQLMQREAQKIEKAEGVSSPQASVDPQEDLLKKYTGIESAAPERAPASMEREPAALKDIDTDFLFKAEGGRRDYGYIPVKKWHISSRFRGTKGTPLGRSGVTVSTGVDLGAQNLDSLRDMGLDSTLYNKLKPYLGLKGTKAQTYLRKNPLNLSSEESKAISKGAKELYYKETVRKYENATDAKFNTLDPRVQTVLMSLNYHTGGLKRGIDKLASEGDIPGLIEKLSNYYAPNSRNDLIHGPRRDKEAEYLKPLLPEKKMSLPQPALDDMEFSAPSIDDQIQYMNQQNQPMTDIQFPETMQLLEALPMSEEEKQLYRERIANATSPQENLLIQNELLSMS